MSSSRVNSVGREFLREAERGADGLADAVDFVLPVDFRAANAIATSVY